ncbi:MAG: hypothetical protein SGPRY_000900 [Prymnesium sp.]
MPAALSESLHLCSPSRLPIPSLQTLRLPPRAVVHSMDAMSSKWRDDPVRAINEKKKARANAEEARSIAQSRAKELLEQKLSQAQKAGDARDLEQVGSLDHDAAYRLENERHRRRLLEGNSDNPSN